MAEERDGDTNFLGGQDASKKPDNVGPSSYYAGINVTTERGSLSPRWGFARRELDFSTAGNFQLPNFKYKSYEELFYSGRFQAAIPYSISNQYYIVVIVSGVIFLINQVTFRVSVLTIAGGSQLNEFATRISWAEAARYLIIFDHPNLPVIIDGISARRSNRALSEVPVAKLGGYNQNRLFIVNAGNEFTAGDPVGLRGVLGANPPLTFLELETPGSDFYGQAFQVATNYANDPVTALTFLQVADQSTGIGPMLISTKKAIWSYMTQNPRATWEAGQFGFLLLYNAGIVGINSHTNVGSDMFFMSAEGEVRALTMSRQEQGKWSKSPLSREVKNWIKFWDEGLKEYAVLGYFRNKLFITANPYHVQATSRIGVPITDVAHGGFAVLELDNISNMRAESSPVWAGLWTGVRPMSMVTNNDRCFIISKDDDRRNYIYEITPESTLDVVDGKKRYIRSRLYTREYDFRLPDTDKALSGLEFNLQNVLGDLKINIKYKPSHGSLWANWRKEWKHNAPFETKGLPTPEQLNGFGGHSFKRLNFGSPEDSEAYNPVTEDSYEQVRKVQLAIDITGKYWELNQIMLRAVPQPTDSLEAVAEDQFKKVPLPVETFDDWAIPENIYV